jgi:hypothetical protein
MARDLEANKRHIAEMMKRIEFAQNEWMCAVPKIVVNGNNNHQHLSNGEQVRIWELFLREFYFLVGKLSHRVVSVIKSMENTIV